MTSRAWTKRAFDVIFSLIALVVTSPILALLSIALSLQDFHSPIYRGVRIGRGEVPFKLLKFRSMIVDAERIPIDTTAANDPRLTWLGRYIRCAKLDELLQFVNVLKGEMSVVGPRPQLVREAALYTQVERGLFCVRPGISDLSSIVFSDLERIVAAEPDPDIAYNQLVRPWKSRLGLLYIEKQSFPLDLAVVGLTVLNFVWRGATLALIGSILRHVGASDELLVVARRVQKLIPAPPPGSMAIVTSRLPANDIGRGLNT